MVSNFLSFQPCYNKKENGEKVCVSSEKIVNFALAFKLSGCSAVGSALRSGRRGRQFDSGHPDRKEGVSKCTHPLFYAQSPDFLKPGLCYFLKFLYL